ncbi:Transcriptional regulator [Paramixta manurensis]|uniref:Transcriptional regulator n=1 Tax=Paramixta manurensis TaxID=2740817 RepID=A0A6M8U8Q3_9GAMM|nr:Transcriptional regulator [Erwiniaceae bacterium PD-1]
MTDSVSLGSFLKGRRLRLDPTALGIPPGRRRTPGLRREEVAQRANISATWYTWLEQGRGGAASPQVLERLAHALLLTEAEREHLFILGLGRSPEIRYQPVSGITPRLQRVLDALGTSPAMIKTPTWDIVAWNRAAATVLSDYNTLPPEDRNVLRMMFLNPRVRAAQYDWESIARYVVAVFRADAARAGAEQRMQALVEELCQASPEFFSMWRDNDVRNFGEGVKRLKHPVLGELALEYSTFAVEGRPDLSMMVYNPIDPCLVERIRALIRQKFG